MNIYTPTLLLTWIYCEKSIPSNSIRLNLFLLKLKNLRKFELGIYIPGPIRTKF